MYVCNSPAWCKVVSCKVALWRVHGDTQQYDLRCSVARAFADRTLQMPKVPLGPMAIVADLRMLGMAAHRQESDVQTHMLRYLLTDIHAYTHTLIHMMLRMPVNLGRHSTKVVFAFDRCWPTFGHTVRTCMPLHPRAGAGAVHRGDRRPPHQYRPAHGGRQRGSRVGNRLCRRRRARLADHDPEDGHRLPRVRALATFDQLEELDVELVYRDPLHDFALLRFDIGGLYLTRHGPS